MQPPLEIQVPGGRNRGDLTLVRRSTGFSSPETDIVNTEFRRENQGEFSKCHHRE